MGRASSAKKVARAARAGGKGAKVGRDRSLLFPGSLALVVVLGLALVVYARGTIDPANVVSPGIADNWIQAYGIYVCDELVADIQNQDDPFGIDSHADGVIHIHPSSAGDDAVTGDDAKLGVFFEAVGGSLSDDRLDLPADEGYDPAVIVEGETTCEGEDGPEDAILQVAYWLSAANTDQDPEIITTGLADIEFNGDGAAYTIAFAPEGADIPPPRTAADLNGAAAEHTNPGSTPTTAAPGDPAATTTVAPGAESAPTTEPTATPTSQP